MKPIIFSSPMAKALLNTKPGVWPAEPIDASKPCKSQTRRVMKPQPLFEIGKPGFWHWKDCRWMGGIADHAPYKVGDILYVREKWCKLWKLDGNDQIIEGTEKYYYAADGYNPTEFNYFLDSNGNHDVERCCPRWKPSIHMPREAARIFLEVKSVRVERLQDISEADAKAEGVEINHHCEKKHKNQKIVACGSPDNKCVDCDLFKTKSFKAGFQYLWNSINAKRSYSLESNPWVWVYEFARVER